MEDKYYNPKITEFYTGFEYEYYSEGLSDLDVDGRSGWYNTIFDLDIEDGEQRHHSQKVRVKYLDQEDIESFLNSSEIKYEFSNGILKLKINNDVRFDGICKNVSELKRIVESIKY